MSAVVSFIVAYFFALSGVTLMPSWVFYLGVAIMVLGIVVRQWSIAVLGRFFSPTLGVQEGQKVVWWTEVLIGWCVTPHTPVFS